MLNATQYEFDVDVYSPIGTVVFEIQILLYMDFDLEVTFSGPESQNFSFNGSRSVYYHLIDHIDGLPTWSVTIEEPLNPDDNITKHQFQLLEKLAANNDLTNFITIDVADVILYERRK